jgi:membrane protease YdiL (CAAX protease family)
MTWPIAVVFTLFATLEPSVAEEMFFRGYMQRRLLELWPPWAAILITSLLFALFHFNLWQGLSVLPYSLWVGYLAWRLNSIWPCILSHALNNFTSSIWNIGIVWGVFTEDPPWPVAVALAIVSFVLFLGAIVKLERQPRPIAGV